MRGIIVLIRHGSNIYTNNKIILSQDILRLDLSNGVNKFTVFAVYGTSGYDDEQFFITLKGHILEAENSDII